MRRMLFMAGLLVCWAAVWATPPARPWLPETGFDPSPRQSLAAMCGARGMDSRLLQLYDDGWNDSDLQEASYDSLGRIDCIHEYWVQEVGDPLELVARTSFEYSDDGRPLHVIVEYYSEGVWYPYGELLYEYEDGLLQEINSNLDMFGGMMHYQQIMFIYWPNTNILKRVVEFTYSVNSPAPAAKKYDYSMDSASRPSEIVLSGISDEWDEWYVQERRNYVYHNDDQTTQESYLRQLAFSVLPLNPTFFTGVQPSKLLEERIYKIAGDDTWYEQNRMFHIYNSDGLLNTIEQYYRIYPLNPEIWTLNLYKDYTFQEGYPIVETTFFPNTGEEDFVPQLRYCLGYQEIVPAEDPVLPVSSGSLSVYPNPFNPSAGISFSLESAGHTEIAVFNLRGQKVRVLLDAEKGAGIHHVSWDGKDGQGGVLAAGIYFIRLTWGSESRSVKAVLAK